MLAELMSHVIFFSALLLMNILVAPVSSKPSKKLFVLLLLFNVWIWISVLITSVPFSSCTSKTSSIWFSSELVLESSLSSFGVETLLFSSLFCFLAVDWVKYFFLYFYVFLRSEICTLIAASEWFHIDLWCDYIFRLFHNTFGFDSIFELCLYFQGANFGFDTGTGVCSIRSFRWEILCTKSCTDILRGFLMSIIHSLMSKETSSSINKRRNRSIQFSSSSCDWLLA